LPNIRHVLVEDAGHAIYRDKPEAVLKARRDMIFSPGK
jgi:pimeloyl-ACP methyl ester carboxylesterase